MLRAVVTNGECTVYWYNTPQVEDNKVYNKLYFDIVKKYLESAEL